MNPSRLFCWYETTRRPAILLAGVVVLIYIRTLPWGFVLDDYRHFQIIEKYESGERPWTPLYQFLTDPKGNRAARMTGEYPWWLADDVRYRHWRPVAERLLYWEFKLFGRNPAGYRIVNLLLYAAGVALVLKVFRRLTGDERLARWGALAFALFTAHTIPVIFISAQGDPLSVVLVALICLGGMKYVTTGRLAPLGAAAMCYVLALGTKESCLPVAIAPLLFEFFRRRDVEIDAERPRRLRRAAIASGVLITIGLVWLALYLRAGYGSNAAIMLNPGQDPIGYLKELPTRAIALLTSLVIPVNPFLFYLRDRGRPALLAFCVAGLILLMGLARMTYKRHRKREGIAAMALWTLMFMPLLVCTVPDDRVMMLPSIGFAFLAGAWITRDKSDAPAPLAKWALALFIVFHPVCVAIACQIMHAVERKGVEALRVARAEFDRELKSGDCIFFLNSTFDSNVLFVQPRFDALVGRHDVCAAFLSDLEDPIVTRIDDRTLRLHAKEGGQFFDGFLGKMSMSGNRPRREGDTYKAREMTATMTKLEGDRVVEAEIRFEDPLESERYRFFKCGVEGHPTPWMPPAP